MFIFRTYLATINNFCENRNQHEVKGNHVDKNTKSTMTCTWDKHIRIGMVINDLPFKHSLKIKRFEQDFNVKMYMWVPSWLFC